MKNIYYIGLMVLMLVVACSDEPIGVDAAGTVTGQAEEVAMSIFGNKEPIPYTVSNMKLAAQELNNRGLSKAAISADDIRATHLYVKFIPKDEKEFYALIMDTVLNVVPVPFDYDLEGFDFASTSFSIGDNPPTQYSVVEVGYPFPKIQYEIIDSLYMPDLSTQQKTSKKSETIPSGWYELEEAAINICGMTNCSSKKSRLIPEGYVYALAGNGDTVFIPNAKIHVNFSTHSHDGYSDSKGHYFIDAHFRNEVHYHVYLQNSNYITSAYNRGEVYAKYVGRTKDKIDFKFTDGVDRRVGLAHAAAYDCYRGNKHGIPTANTNKGIKIKVNDNCGQFDKRARENDKSTYIADVCCHNDFSYKSIYESVMYEFVRSKYFFDTPVLYNNVYNEKYYNSWCLYAANKLTEDKFHKEFMIDKTKYKPTTTFFYDLIDEIDPDPAHHDEVERYTEEQILSIVYRSYGFDDFIKKLADKYDNPTEDKLERLMFYHNR